MPSRHSKNASDQHHFTYHEREQAGYGTQKTRFGADSQLPFGHCALCIKPCDDPMATPSGRLYCRECIVSYLLQKTRDLKHARVLYDAQESAKEAEVQEAVASAQTQALVEFVEGQGAQGASASVDQGKKRRREYAGLEGDAGNESKEERLEAIKRTSWWLPQFTPEAEGKDLEPPPKRPASPVSGEPLRVKDLTAAILSKDEAGNVICPVTQREMKSQQAVIITPSGYIMLESAAEQFALPSMTCPMTGKKIKSRHIQQLQRSGSSFAAAGQVEAEVYRPTMR